MFYSSHIDLEYRCNEYWLLGWDLLADPWVLLCGGGGRSERVTAGAHLRSSDLTPASISSVPRKSSGPLIEGPGILPRPLARPTSSWSRRLYVACARFSRISRRISGQAP